MENWTCTMMDRETMRQEGENKVDFCFALFVDWLF